MQKIWISARQVGKTAAMDEMERDFIKDHPDAVIVRGDGRIEKPVKAVVIEPKQLTNET